MTDAGREYFLRRAGEERERAASSEDPDIAERHAQLARLYDLRAQGSPEWEKLSTQFST